MNSTIEYYLFLKEPNIANGSIFLKLSVSLFIGPQSE